MFSIHELEIPQTLLCTNRANHLQNSDFQYFDKDGFELNIAEQKFYRAMGYNLDNGVLNHICREELWMELEPAPGLYLDHSMIMYRCSYAEDAEQQIREYSSIYPYANILLQATAKWGYDFDLNAISESGQVFEVLHIEYDSTDYNTFIESKCRFEEIVTHTDWQDIADKVWDYRDKWQHLKGYQQNHWKAKYILDWEESEVLEKVLK